MNETERADHEMDDLARRLPDGEPDPSESAVMRRAVLFAIGRARRRRVLAWRVAAIVACVVAGVLSVIVIEGSRSGRRPDDPGLVVRTTRIEQNTGSTTYDVAPRGRNERFVVVTPDAEVEVRGTRFTIAVEPSSTSVEVVHGRVEVREREGRARHLLGAGQHTRVARRPVPVAAGPTPPPAAAVATPQDAAAAARETEGAARAPQRILAARARIAPSDPAGQEQAVAPRSSAELASFRAAHDLHFGRNDFAAALEAWNRYLAAYPQGSLAQEARYNRAVCLLRLGRAADADPDLSAISGSPNAFRAREARLLRGAALASEGRCEEAQAILAPLAAGSDEVARRAAALQACR